MSIVGSLFRAFSRGDEQQRAVTFQQVWGTGADALRPSDPTGLIPLFSAHRLIIDAVASSPLHAYVSLTDGARERAARQPGFLERPTDLVGPFAWKAQIVASLLYDGNAFGIATDGVDSAGYPNDVVWLDPKHVSVEAGGRFGRRYFLDRRELDPLDVVHIPWIVPPGDVRGVSPLRAFRTAIEMGQAAQAAGLDWFRNGMVPSGHLKNTMVELDPAQAAELKARFKATTRGRDLLVTGMGFEYSTIGVPADEAYFVESMKLTATQIAAVYGIPPQRIGGESGDSMTYKTLESDQLMLNTQVTRSWAIRIEEGLRRFMPPNTFARFNLDAHVRADTLTRAQVHEINLRTGVETLDEARALEDRPPLSPEEKAALRPPTPPAPPTIEGTDDDPTD